jgi:hypothetical protein
MQSILPEIQHAAVGKDRQRHVLCAVWSKAANGTEISDNLEVDVTKIPYSIHKKRV